MSAEECHGYGKILLSRDDLDLASSRAVGRNRREAVAVGVATNQPSEQRSLPAPELPRISVRTHGWRYSYPFKVYQIV